MEFYILPLQGATTGEVLINRAWHKLSIGKLPLASNQILQCIALALDNNMDSGPAVRKLTGICSSEDPTGVKRALFEVYQNQSEAEVCGEKRFRRVTVWDEDYDDDGEELGIWEDEDYLNNEPRNISSMESSEEEGTESIMDVS